MDLLLPLTFKKAANILQQLTIAIAPNQVSKRTNKRSIDVGGRLRMTEVLPIICKCIILIGATNHSSS